jgi:hypothetical protein
MYNLYLDDVRTPTQGNWIVVRNYDEFVETINRIGLNSISWISLDHDLGEEAMIEYYTNVKHNNTIDYSNIVNEKTGMDCCKFLVGHCLSNNITLPDINIHSANPVGVVNMMSYLDNFFKHTNSPKKCSRTIIPHTIHESHLITPEERKEKWEKWKNENKIK